MSLNSINTNIGAYYAQSNIGKASNMASSAISRLSSGNRIVQAKDDVAAMSAGTSLRTNVTTLRMALINTSQGASLLQVADGALSQITDILQRQKAIAVQAGSGSLTDSERGFLNQEFQNLSQEIDRLVGQTNFNGVELLNGSLSETTDVSDVVSIGDKATMSITFQQNIGTGATATLRLNGVDVTFSNVAGTGDVLIGADIETTLDNLVTVLNSGVSTATTGFTAVERELLQRASYARQGTSLVITSRAAGSIGETYTVDTSLATSTALRLDPATATTRRIASITGQHYNRVTAVISGIAVADLDTSAVTAAGTTAGLFKNGNIAFEGNLVTANHVTVAVAAGATDTLNEIVAAINANTATHGVSARVSGYSGNYSLIFERNYNPAVTGDETGNNAPALNINNAAFTAFNNGGLTGAANVAEDVQTITALQGGTNTGLGAGRVNGSGLIGNSILTGQNQTRASVTISFPDIADADLLTAANFGGTTKVIEVLTGYANTGGANDTVKFGFVNTTPRTDTEVQIGSSLEETLDNLVSRINSYTGFGSTTYEFQQIEARREGLNVIIQRRDVGDVGQVNNFVGTTNFMRVQFLGAANTPTGATVFGGIANAGNLDNGSSTGGINTSGVTNKDFIGKISGFTASYASTNDSLTLSVRVGSNTYSALIADTTPAANTTVRMISQDGGGYFDIELAANQGQTVASQDAANVFAQRINSAFQSMTFSQNRSISSYAGNAPIITNGVVTGSLIGTSASLQLSDFSDVKIDRIRVTAPQGSNENGAIEFTINGETYRTNANIGSRLGANAVFYLTSTQDSERFLEFRTGATAIQFDTEAKAAAFESALQTAFGVGNGSAALNFQVGSTTTDTLAVSISNVSTEILFDGQSLNVLTAANAALASDALDAAIDRVTSARAEVGALQSRFDFAAANVESSIQNQDAARGVLLDTDIAAESTAFSQAQVKMQAGIAVLAQANLLPQNLLKLIG